jgi:metal-responsive CopG/Arc/MetJ family transcriptional regulator
MTTISLRLPDNLLREVEERAGDLHVPRAEYVRRALERMNREVLQQKRRTRLMEISLRVREESMNVNAEFSEVEHEPEV